MGPSENVKDSGRLLRLRHVDALLLPPGRLELSMNQLNGSGSLPLVVLEVWK